MKETSNIRFLKKGEMVKGNVEAITGNAAYVKVNNFQTGILYKEDVCNVRIENISEKLNIGDQICAVVKRYDHNTGKLVLSLKSQKDINFDGINIGMVMSGIVRNRYKNGVFVEIKPDLVGLADYKNCVSYGEKVDVKVKKIDYETQKIKLDILG